MEPGPSASSDTPVGAVTVIADGDDAWSLARDMIEVHGVVAAAAVARENARAAARDGQVTRAKSWIKVLGVIQQHLSGGASSTVADAR